VLVREERPFKEPFEERSEASGRLDRTRGGLAGGSLVLREGGGVAVYIGGEFCGFGGMPGNREEKVLLCRKGLIRGEIVAG